MTLENAVRRWEDGVRRWNERLDREIQSPEFAQLDKRTQEIRKARRMRVDDPPDLLQEAMELIGDADQ